MKRKDVLDSLSKSPLGIHTFQYRQPVFHYIIQLLEFRVIGQRHSYAMALLISVLAKIINPAILLEVPKNFHNLVTKVSPIGSTVRFHT